MARFSRLLVLNTMIETGLVPVFHHDDVATAEAIVNALVAAETMEGADGHIAHRLPHDRLAEVWHRYRH